MEAITERRAAERGGRGTKLLCSKALSWQPGPGSPVQAARSRRPVQAPGWPTGLACRDRGGRGLPVGTQRHVGLSVGFQPDPEDLVELHDVAVEAEA